MGTRVAVAAKIEILPYLRFKTQSWPTSWQRSSSSAEPQEIPLKYRIFCFIWQSRQTEEHDRSSTLN